MLKREVKKISIVMLIAIILVVPTGFLVGALLPEERDITETEQKINGVRLRDYIKNLWTDYQYIPDPSESSNLPLYTTVQRFSTVHFEVTIRNIVDRTIEIADFFDELPANFVSFSNGNIKVVNGVIDPSGRTDKTFDEVFVVENKPLNEYASSTFSRITITMTDDIPGNSKVLASLNTDGYLVIEFDAVASDIIGLHLSSADATFEQTLIWQFLTNRVYYEQGPHMVYGKVEGDSCAEVHVNPNLKMEKQVALVPPPEEKSDGEPPKPDNGPKDYTKLVVAHVGDQVEFLISIEAPLGREGYNDRDYYFKEIDITDTLPEELRYNSSEIQLEGIGGGTITEENGVLQGCYLGKITALYITIKTDIISAGVGRNSVYIRGEASSDSLIFYINGFKVQPSMWYDKTDSAYVDVKGYASIDVDKKVWDAGEKKYVDAYDYMPPVIYNPGDTVWFEVTLTNTGDFDLSDVEITDELSTIFEEVDCTEMINDLLGQWNRILEVGQDLIILSFSVDIREQSELPYKEDPIKALFGTNIVSVKANYSYEELQNYGGVFSSNTIVTKYGEVSDSDIVKIAVEGINKSVQISNPSPPDKSEDISIDLSELSVLIEDPEGDSFDWRIECYSYIDPELFNPDESKSPDEEYTYDYVGDISGFNDYNGTKVLPITERLMPKTKYVWTVEAIDKACGIKKIANYEFTTGEEPPNMPPVLSEENPVDESGEVPLDFPEVNVLIEDPDGDSFNWNITSSFGQSEGFDEPDGVKTCPITEPLLPGTLYTWIVEATDVGSGETTHVEFTFTTVGEPVNRSPVMSNEYPASGSTDVDIWLSELYVTIVDPEGDLFNWSIETFPYIGNNSATDDSDGIKFCYSMMDCDCSLEYSTLYTWYVTATDQVSGMTTQEVYTFTTEAEPQINHPPEAPTDPYPHSDMNYVPIYPTKSVELSVDVSDQDGDAIDVTFFDASDYSVIGSDNGVASETSASCVWSMLDYETSYSWYAVADDGNGGSTTSDTWVFTTEENPFPGNHEPTVSNPNPADGAEGIVILHGELIYVELSVTVTDEDGNSLDVTFYADDDTLLAEVEDIASGETATLLWSDVTYSTEYGWYVVVNDGKGGVTTSEIFTFTTQDVEIPEPEVIIIKPLENFLYLMNKSICPLKRTLIIGAIQIEATVTDNPLSPTITTVKFFIDDEEMASYEYDISNPFYSYYWDELSFFQYTIKVVAYDGTGDVVASAERDVSAFIW